MREGTKVSIVEMMLPEPSPKGLVRVENIEGGWGDHARHEGDNSPQPQHRQWP